MYKVAWRGWVAFGSVKRWPEDVCYGKGGGNCFPMEERERRLGRSRQREEQQVRWASYAVKFRDSGPSPRMYFHNVVIMRGLEKARASQLTSWKLAAGDLLGTAGCFCFAVQCLALSPRSRIFVT